MNAIEREFESIASKYETNRLAEWYKAHADEVLSECPPHIDGDILDVGCGTGYLLRKLLQRYPQSRGVGLDLAGAMVKQAAQLAAAESVANVSFIKADWEVVDLRELAECEFKLVVCANAFHYFSNPQLAAKKLFDVLAPGGLLFVLERNKSDSRMTQIWGWIHEHIIKDNVVFYDVVELKYFFQESGFSGVQVVRNIRRLMWKNKIYTDVVLVACVKER